MWKGSTITGTLAGRSGVVAQRLGEGTFGSVNELRYADGTIGAVKLLKHERSPEKEEQVAEQCRITAPHPSFFGWPTDYGRRADGALFFTMKKVPQKYRPLNHYLAGKLALTPRALVRICFNLADAFASLHFAGLLFNDISRNQLCISKSGDVAIVDCDNTCFAGSASVVRGTRGYMTPMLERGDEPVSMMTDAFALGVLLFELLIGGHPLSGMKESTFSYVDEAQRDAWYKTTPLFVFSDSDRSNWPDPTTIEGTMLERWKELPSALRDFFKKDFDGGLNDSRSCVLETEWREYLCWLEDALFECRGCRQPLFHDRETLPLCCPHCDRAQSPRLLKIHFDRRTSAPPAFVVAVGNDTRLYAHHLQRMRGFDHTPAGRIVRGNATDRRFVGLQNQSSDPWKVKEANGGWRLIPPQDVVPLYLGTTIYFPRAVAVLV